MFLQKKYHLLFLILSLVAGGSFFIWFNNQKLSQTIDEEFIVDKNELGEVREYKKIPILGITSSSAVVANNGKVLSVDGEGNVILVEDKTSESGGAKDSYSDLPQAEEGNTLYFDGENWTSSNVLLIANSRVGIGRAEPKALLHLQNSDPELSPVVFQAAEHQKANFTEWRNSDGNSVVVINADGGATFNEQGKKASFRIKASDNANAFYLDGNTGYLGLGTDTPNHKLDIKGDASVSGKLSVVNSSDNNHLIELYPTGNTGHLSSNGGAFYIDNTNNVGAGYLVYSNGGAEALGNLLNVKVDNANFAQAGFYISYDGSSNGVEIVHNGNDTSANALSITNNNRADSALGVIGYETSRGTIKVTHNGSSSTANASGISIDLKGTGTATQGLYVDSTATGGTTGNLLRLRNESTDRFVVNYLGAVTMGATGTNTSFTKKGNNANDEFFVGTTGAFRVQRSATASEAFRVQVAGDTQGRWLGTSDGQLKWGDGSSTQDVTLRRSAAGTLLLDGGRIEIKSGSTNSDVFVVTASDGSRLGRITETSGGHGWFEIDDNTGAAKFLFRADGGDSYFNSGEVGIGLTGPGYKFDVSANSAGSYASNFFNDGNNADRYGVRVQAGADDGSGTTYYLTALDGDGDIVGYLQNSSGTFGVNDVSDVRTKTNIVDTTLDGIDIIKNLRVVDFNRLSQPSGKLHHGFIAQEVDRVFPYMVSSNADGYLSISKDSLIPVLVKAVQQQDLKIQALGELADNKDYQNELQTLKNSVTQLLANAELQKAEQSLWYKIGQSFSFLKQTVFESTVEFKDQVTLAAKVLVKDRIQYQNPDVAGFVVFAENQESVSVNFVKPQAHKPVITLTAEGAAADLYLSEVSISGFTIKRSGSLPAITVHWTALVNESAPNTELVEQASDNNLLDNPIIEASEAAIQD